jgi:hypothetical protein
MSTRSSLLTLAAVAVLAGAVLAQQGPDPIIAVDARSDVEIDLGLMVDDLMPLIADALAASDEDGEDAQVMMRVLTEVMGIEALDRLRMKTRQGRDHLDLESTVSLDRDAAPDGVLARLAAIDDRECRFARYLHRDDLAMAVVVHDLRAQMEVMLDMLAHPAMAELMDDLPVDEAGELSMNGFSPRRDLLPLLAGEFDVMMLDMPTTRTAMAIPMPPVLLAIASTDGPALRDSLVAMVDRLAGDAMGGMGGMGAMLEAMPVQTAGAFEVVETPFGIAMATSDDFLVLGPAGAPLRDLLAEADGDLEVPDGLSWRYMHGPRYAKLMDELTAMAGMVPGDAASSDWLTRLSPTYLRNMHEQVELVRTDGDRFEIEGSLEGPAMTGFYRMAREWLADLPQTMAAERRERERRQRVNRYRAIMMKLDAALTQYGIDHDGLFPLHPTELVAAGYLDEFPLEREVPAGMYVEGAYTYHPLHDQDGDVAGYFLFIYAGGEDAGYDVYTPDNVDSEGDYWLESDGDPDGVATFCYDGLAIPQMEAWQAR